MPIIHDGHFRLHKLPMGPYDNNAYIIYNPTEQECYIVPEIGPCDGIFILDTKKPFYRSKKAFSRRSGS